MRSCVTSAFLYGHNGQALTIWDRCTRLGLGSFGLAGLPLLFLIARRFPEEKVMYGCAVIQEQSALDRLNSAVRLI